MANKRRDQPSGDKSVHHSNSKRDKCTLENVRLRELRVLLRRTEVGQLGLGPDIQEESQPAQVPLDHKVVDICAGSMHTVCLTKEGKVITFEYNDEGVTEGKEVDLPGKVIKISAGDSHTVALLEDERAFSWRTFRFHDSYQLLDIILATLFAIVALLTAALTNDDGVDFPYYGLGLLSYDCEILPEPHLPWIFL